MKAYILSIKEVTVLLNCMGFENCYGICTDDLKFSENEIANIINDLIRKDILDFEEENYILRKEYAKVLSGIAYARKIIIFHSNHWEDEFCLYVGDRILKCRQNQYHSQKYVMEYIKKEDIKEILYEKKIIFKESEEEEIFQKNFKENTYSDILQENVDEIIKKDGVESITEVIDLLTQGRDTITIFKGGVCCHLITNINNIEERTAYSEKEYLKNINEIMGEREWLV